MHAYTFALFVIPCDLAVYRMWRARVEKHISRFSYGWVRSAHNCAYRGRKSVLRQCRKYACGKCLTLPDLAGKWWHGNCSSRLGLVVCIDHNGTMEALHEIQCASRRLYSYMMKRFSSVPIYPSAIEPEVCCSFWMRSMIVSGIHGSGRTLDGNGRLSRGSSGMNRLIIRRAALFDFGIM